MLSKTIIATAALAASVAAYDLPTCWVSSPHICTDQQSTQFFNVRIVYRPPASRSTRLSPRAASARTPLAPSSASALPLAARPPTLRPTPHGSPATATLHQSPATPGPSHPAPTPSHLPPRPRHTHPHHRPTRAQLSRRRLRPTPAHLRLPQSSPTQSSPPHTPASAPSPPP